MKTYQTMSKIMSLSGNHRTTLKRTACRRLAVAVIVGLLVATATVPCQSFERALGGPKADYVYRVLPTDNGGYIAVGSSYNTDDPHAMSDDLYVVRTDAGGNELWHRVFGRGPKCDVGLDIQPTADGGWVMVGRSNANGPDDVYLVKINPDGTSRDWTFGPPYVSYDGDSNIGFAVHQLADGDFLIAGTKMGMSLHIRIDPNDPNGNPKWLRTDDRGERALTLEDPLPGSGTILSVERSSSGTLAFRTIELEYGNTVWWFDTLYPVIISGFEKQGFGSTLTLDKRHVVVAATAENSDGTHVQLFKASAYGTLEPGWPRDIPHVQAFDHAFGVVQDSNRGFSIVGRTGDSLAEYNGLLIKTDENGDILWSRTFGGPHIDSLYGIMETESGGHVLAGYTHSFGLTDDFHPYLISVDSNGDVLWSRGDLNDDGMTTAQDAEMAYCFLTGCRIPTTSEKLAADCNGDGELQYADVEGIFLQALGIQSCSPP